MKLLTLVGVSVAASCCYKAVKNKTALTKSNFDEIIKQSVLRDFAV